MARMIDLQRMLEMQQLANVNNDSEGDFQSNPFAFSYPSFEPTPYVEPALAQYFDSAPNPYVEPALAQYFTPAAPAKTTSSGYSQIQEKGMVPIYSQPVYETRGHGNQVLVDQGGKFLGYQKPEATPAEGKIETPKPPEILAKEKELGHELEPIYAMGTVQHGSGTSQPVEYGEPIGYRYDNGKSQYVNFDTSGQQTSIQDRQNLGTLIRDLAPLALAALGANFLVPMLSGAGAGGAGLLGETAALGAGEVASLTPLTFTPEMIAAGTFTPGSIGALGASAGLLSPEALAAAGGLLTQGATPALIDMAAQGAQNYLDSGGGAQGGIGGGPNGTDILRNVTDLPYQPPLETPPLEPEYPYQPPLETPPIEEPIPSGPPSTPGTPPPPNVGPPGSNIPFELPSLPSLSTIKDALTVASIVSSVANSNKTEPTAAPFTMAPYVPPSGKPFANLGMSPIATPYTPTRIAGQYDPTMTPGGVSPYELIMQQMQAPKNLYANFEAGTNIGGFDPQRFVLPPAAAATALPNNMGGMINKSRMVGPNPMGPDNGFASIQDGEFVMNRKATAKYGIELMNAINSGKISKGKLSGLLEA